jgi:hypothetical protein
MIGRAWLASELRTKSFADLHVLWYLCLRERNLYATQQTEMDRLRISVNRENVKQNAGIWLARERRSRVSRANKFN